MLACATLNMPMNKPTAHKPVANDLKLAFFIRSFFLLLLTFAESDIWLDIQATTRSFTQWSVFS